MTYSTVKKCSAGAILGLALALPEFQMLSVSFNGLKLIVDYEGCRLSPYQCTAGVWTNGIGNTRGVSPSETITETRAALDFIKNISDTEQSLRHCIKRQVPQQVYDATVSLAFNVGAQKACGSTLVSMLNAGRWLDACNQLPRWVYAGGVIDRGLQSRRQRELDWCLKGVPSYAQAAFATGGAQ